MSYSPTIPTVAAPVATTRSLPGPGNLTLTIQESGRCYLRQGTVRLGTAILLDADQPGAYLSHLIIKAQYRRKGYGRRLLQELLRLTRNAGCEGFSLHVNASNTAAVALYRKLGFFVCTTITDSATVYMMAYRFTSYPTV